MYGTPEEAAATCRFAPRPMPFVQVCGVNTFPAPSTIAAILRAVEMPPMNVQSGWYTSRQPFSRYVRISSGPRLSSPPARRSVGRWEAQLQRLDPLRDDLLRRLHARLQAAQLAGGGVRLQLVGATAQQPVY